MPRYHIAGIMAGLLCTTAAIARTPEAAAPAFMPLPVEVEIAPGRVPVSPHMRVDTAGCADTRAQGASTRFLEALARRGDGDRQAAVALELRCGSDEGEEYRLTVSPAAIRVDAAGPLGVLRALATLRQAVDVEPSGLTLPRLQIADRPRFAWRGVTIDVARHFISITALKRQIDAMEAVKLNILHLHLSDDQGFRVESLRFPKLREIAANGEYYTQAEIRDLVAYAAARGIIIVPEFDVPGHSLALLTAYPEFASGPVPTGYLAGARVALDPSNLATYAFLDELFGEMAGLFPAPYFHVGGDEVGPAAFANSPRIADFMAREGIKDKAGLEAWFMRGVHAIVTRHGKIMIGWDEIAESEIADDIIVQAWRSSTTTGRAARQGNQVIVSAGYYLDLLEPAAFHYAADPLDPAAAGLTPEEGERARAHPLLGMLLTPGHIRQPGASLSPDAESRILGGEAALWTELVTEEMLDGRLWPRLASIAERLWSPAEVRDPHAMYQRLDGVMTNLRRDGLVDSSARARMIAAIAPGDTAAVAELVDLVVPVRNFAHRQPLRQLLAGQPITAQSLDQVADIATPDSLTARRFEADAQDFVTAGMGAADLKRRLSQWRDNHDRFAAAATGHPALAAAIPVSADIAALARAGLDAIEAAERGTPLSAERRQEIAALLDRQQQWEEASRSIVAVVTAKEQPPADLLIAITPGVRILVDAVSR